MTRTYGCCICDVLVRPELLPQLLCACSEGNGVTSEHLSRSHQQATIPSQHEPPRRRRGHIRGDTATSSADDASLQHSTALHSTAKHGTAMDGATLAAGNLAENHRKSHAMFTQHSPLTIDTNTCYTETTLALHTCTLWWWAHATRCGATASYPQTPPTRASAQTAGRPRILTAHSPQ